MAISKPQARRPRRAKITPAQKKSEDEGNLNKHWRTYFLQALAASSNVAASAASIGASTSRVYKARREEPDFAAAWRAALNEGYEHLEMEVLAYLRGNDPERKLDVANALRLLAAHRQTVAEIRSYDNADNEQAVLDSIDQLIDRMRSEAHSRTDNG